MIAHNLEDDNVLFQNSAQLIAALENAGKHFELSLYTREDPRRFGGGGPADGSRPCWTSSSAT